MRWWSACLRRSPRPPSVRIVSLLASGTEIVCALGAGDLLVGRSHECDHPEWVRSLPVCTSPAFPIDLSGAAIDREVRRRLAAGEPLYYVDRQLLEELAPDLLISQAHCEVCAVTPADVERTGYARSSPGTVLALSAGSLAGIWDGIFQVGAALDRADEAEGLIQCLKGKLNSVRQQTQHRGQPTVVMLEWTDPLFAMGNWGAELVEVANGRLLLGEPGQYSRTISWDLVRQADPEYLIIAPCGFDLQRTLSERALLEGYPGWAQLRAVREGKVAFADGNRYFNRSGTTIADTAEILSEILHGLDHGWRGRAWRPLVES